MQDNSVARSRIKMTRMSLMVYAFIGLPLYSVGAQTPANENWTWTRFGDADTTYLHVVFQRTRDSLTGFVEGSGQRISGSFRGRIVEAILTDSLGKPLRQFSGNRFGNDSIVGSTTTLPAHADTMFWKAARVSRRPGRIFSYYPPASLLNHQYYGAGRGAYSAAVPAGLHIISGDTVRMKSREEADAPIFIDDALPGDVLVVHILRIAPADGTAYSGRELMYQWVTSSYARIAGEVPKGNNNWILDTLTNTARLEQNTGHVRGLTIPMRPSLGAIGVAPRVPQHYSEEGEWGGNLDYKALTAGSALSLPVFYRGAYLY